MQRLCKYAFPTIESWQLQHKTESSFKTPTYRDMSLGSEELNLVESALAE
jgi:hypothetical protein